MNVLDKITWLRLERNWSEYQLAEKSGLTQSTISTWYRKNMLPTIPSLIKICDAFGLTLSQFFLEDDGNTIHITERQNYCWTMQQNLVRNNTAPCLIF